MQMPGSDLKKAARHNDPVVADLQFFVIISGMAQEWNIRPRGHACGICAQVFVDKQACVSVLRDLPDGFERRDYCLNCWKSEARDWQPFSFWEGNYEAPIAAVREEPVKKETAETLLRHLIMLEDPAMRHVVYVLAVMLERGKQLVERASKSQEGGILRIYEHKKTGDVFTVLDPRLRLEELGDVQRQVVALLSGTHPLQSATGHPEAAPGTPDTPALPPS